MSTGTEDEVSKALVEFDEVEEVATIYGEYDAIIKVAAKDMNDLDDFISSKLRSVPNIFMTSTMIIAREHK
ncbi:MAG: Lrp/AsnC ligand binding domain-containing protein [Candidatus Bathyarchaeota archaeon]|nr:Lrp/AsnC ligand binding domain-containing protein [Candidatus Bathyarchaeota archaeon]